MDFIFGSFMGWFLGHETLNLPEGLPLIVGSALGTTTAIANFILISRLTKHQALSISKGELNDPEEKKEK